jgi:hypothetical protein
VIRYLLRTNRQWAARDGKPDECGEYGFWLGDDHPAYAVMLETLPRVRKPYAFYMRVPDLPDFLQLIKPVLEQRLAASPYAGHTGELKITFYRRGLKLIWVSGRLVGVENWRPAPQGHSGEAAFPELTFLQMLFGYRSFEELEYAFPDCWWENDQILGLINALFPKQFSDVWPIA